MSTEVMSARRFGQPTSRLSMGLGGSYRRESLGSACGNTTVKYTSSGITSNTITSNKRAFSVNDENVDYSHGGYTASSVSAPAAKRSRCALKDTNIVIFCDDAARAYDSDSNGKHRHALAERKAVASSANSRASLLKVQQGSAKITMDVVGKEPRKQQLSEKKRAPSSSLHKRASSLSPSSSSSPKKIKKKSFSRVEPAAGKAEANLHLLHKAVERARGVDCATPRTYTGTNESAATEKLPVLQASWQFEIYEDTPDEMMQNLMEHSAGILDISDESDDEKCRHDEIVYRGKENISPERMVELMATRDEGHMEVDYKLVAPSKSNKPTTSEKRNALGELSVAELYPAEVAALVEEAVVASKKHAHPLASSTLASATEFGKKGGADFEVWESAGESEDEKVERNVAVSARARSKTPAVETDNASDKEN